MERKDLIQNLEERRVRDVLSSMYRQLQLHRRPTQGKITYAKHRALELITLFSVRCEFYEDGTYPRDETFNDCRNRNSELYDGFLDIILGSVNDYGAKV